jgi:glyoxylase-like metal-dependent hydrolase (beta-lactamase superfamily II)
MTTFRVHDVRGRFPVLPSHVHGYVVELGDAVVVVDATAALSSAREMRSIAEGTGKPLQAVLMTHGHPDHFTGLTEFADVPRYASQAVIDFAHAEDEAKWESGKMYLGDDFPDTRVFPDTVVRDGDVLTFGGVDFHFVELGPAESDSDSCWWCEVDGVKHAFIGDVISNGVHGFFGDGHARNWLAVLDRLQELFDDDTRFYIGHGDSPVGLAAIDRQRAYVQTFLDTV